MDTPLVSDGTENNQAKGAHQSTGLPALASSADRPPIRSQLPKLGSVLVTIHGTFARGAPWAKPDSTIAKAVRGWFDQQNGSATIVPFEWSGRNSIAARRIAGAALVEHLDRIRHDHPSAAIYVIAHSHGGGVFAYSAKLRPEIVDQVDGFVGLATPWVGVQPCTYAVALRKMLGKLTLFVVYAGSLLALTSLIFWVSRHAGALDLCQLHGDLSKDDLHHSIGCMGQTITVLAWSLYAAAGVGLLFFPLQRLVSKWLDSTADGFWRQLEASAKQLSTLNERLPPAAFLKPIGDEVALALTWTSAMAALMQSVSALLFCVLQSVRDLWTRIPRVVRGIGGVIFTVLWSCGTAGVANWIMVSVVKGEADWSALNLFSIVDFSSPLDALLIQLFFAVSAALAEFSWAVMALLAAVLLGVLLIAFIAAAGAGTASLRAALYFRIGIEAIPCGHQQLDLVDTSPATAPDSRLAFGGLSHSELYNSPGAIDAVIRALARFERGRADRSSG